MLINLTNHPSTSWSEQQRVAALEKYGEIKDIPFPDIDPVLGKKEVVDLAAGYFLKISKIYSELPQEEKKRFAIHVQGEHTFVHHLLKQAEKLNLTCIASTTRRIKKDLGNGQSLQQFEFVRFREY